MPSCLTKASCLWFLLASVALSPIALSKPVANYNGETICPPDEYREAMIDVCRKCPKECSRPAVELSPFYREFCRKQQKLGQCLPSDANDSQINTKISAGPEEHKINKSQLAEKISRNTLTSGLGPPDKHTGRLLAPHYIVLIVLGSIGILAGLVVAGCVIIIRRIYAGNRGMTQKQQLIEKHQSDSVGLNNPDTNLMNGEEDADIRDQAFTQPFVPRSEHRSI